MATANAPAENPFVIPFSLGKKMGQGFVPAPLFNSQGEFNPALDKAADIYARKASNYAKGALSSRGLWDSSMAAPALMRSYREGFNDVSGQFLQQQQMYGGISQQLMAALAGTGPEANDPSFLQKSLTGAAAGASVGMAFGPKGAGIGAGAGALLGALGLFGN